MVLQFHKYAHTDKTSPEKFRKISVCSIQCIQRIIFSTVSAELVPVILGHDITLRCPVGLSTSDDNHSIKEWFRGPVSDTRAMVARLVTSGDQVEFNYTADKKMWIISMAGDLIIQNLTLGDVGFYNCHFTGSKTHIIQLNIRGMFYCLFFLSDILSIKISCPKLTPNNVDNLRRFTICICI